MSRAKLLSGSGSIGKGSVGQGSGDRDSVDRNSGGTDSRDWYDRRVLLLFVLGISAGIPILLIFSTLSLWLREAGVSKSAVTYFSWAALGYSFKFVWAPLVDKVPIPLFNRLGRRRSWLLIAQFAVIAAIVLMALTDPQNGLRNMAFAAVFLGFSSATQDIVIDAYRIECAGSRLQALLSSAYIAGYRVGMVIAGAGSLYLASHFGSTTDHYSYDAWRLSYFCMAAAMGLGVCTTMVAAEPDRNSDKSYPYSGADYCRFVLLFVVAAIGFIAVHKFWPAIDHSYKGGTGKLIDFIFGSIRMLLSITVFVALAIIGARTKLVNSLLVDEGYIQPVMDFFRRYGRLALWVLLLIGFYRVSDIVMGIVANVFYQDIGFSKKEIASVTKVFGLLMTIVGSFAGGFLAVRFGVIRILMLGAVLAAVSNLLFMWLANMQMPEINALISVIAADNFSAGLATAAFVAWLSSLTNLSFTAVQYALFSSFMTLFPKLLGGYSGTAVETFGYGQFFLATALLGIPVMILVWYLSSAIDSFQSPE